MSPIPGCKRHPALSGKSRARCNWCFLRKITSIPSWLSMRAKNCAEFKGWMDLRFRVWCLQPKNCWNCLFSCGQVLANMGILQAVLPEAPWGLSSAPGQNHWIVESLRLEKTSKVTEPRHDPSTATESHVPKCQIL